MARRTDLGRKLVHDVFVFLCMYLMRDDLHNAMVSPTLSVVCLGLEIALRGLTGESTLVARPSDVGQLRR